MTTLRGFYDVDVANQLLAELDELPEGAKYLLRFGRSRMKLEGDVLVAFAAGVAGSLERATMLARYSSDDEL